MMEFLNTEPDQLQNALLQLQQTQLTVEDDAMIELHHRLSSLSQMARTLLPMISPNSSTSSAQVKENQIEPSVLEFHVTTVLDAMRHVVTFMYSIATRTEQANYILQTALKAWVQAWKEIYVEWEAYLDTIDINQWDGFMLLKDHQKWTLHQTFSRAYNIIQSQVASLLKYGEIMTEQEQLKQVVMDAQKKAKSNLLLEQERMIRELEDLEMQQNIQKSAKERTNKKPLPSLPTSPAKQPKSKPPPPPLPKPSFLSTRNSTAITATLPQNQSIPSANISTPLNNTAKRRSQSFSSVPSNKNKQSDEPESPPYSTDEEDEIPLNNIVRGIKSSKSTGRLSPHPSKNTPLISSSLPPAFETPQPLHVKRGIQGIQPLEIKPATQNDGKKKFIRLSHKELSARILNDRLDAAFLNDAKNQPKRATSGNLKSGDTSSGNDRRDESSSNALGKSSSSRIPISSTFGGTIADTIPTLPAPVTLQAASNTNPISHKKTLFKGIMKENIEEGKESVSTIIPEGGYAQYIKTQLPGGGSPDSQKTIYWSNIQPAPGQAQNTQQFKHDLLNQSFPATKFRGEMDDAQYFVSTHAETGESPSGKKPLHSEAPFFQVQRGGGIIEQKKYLYQDMDSSLSRKKSHRGELPVAAAPVSDTSSASSPYGDKEMATGGLSSSTSKFSPSRNYTHSLKKVRAARTGLGIKLMDWCVLCKEPIFLLESRWICTDCKLCIHKSCLHIFDVKSVPCTEPYGTKVSC